MMLYLSWVTTAHIYNVNLTTPPLPIAHNTDGMDIDCSVDVLIENCHYQGSEYETCSIDQKPKMRRAHKADSIQLESKNGPAL